MFEVWLLYHKLTDLKDIDCSKSHNVKVALSKLTPGGFSATEYVKLMAQAIINAKPRTLNLGSNITSQHLKKPKCMNWVRL